MADKYFKQFIENQADERIEVVDYSVTYPRNSGVGNRAVLKIDIRKIDERDDEIAYWMEELKEISGVIVRYLPPNSMKGVKKITIVIDQVSRHQELEFAHAA